MASKARCKRCGSYVPAGYVECPPKVVAAPLPLWLNVGAALGLAGWLAALGQGVWRLIDP